MFIDGVRNYFYEVQKLFHTHDKTAPSLKTYYALSAIPILGLVKQWNYNKKISDLNRKPLGTDRTLDTLRENIKNESSLIILSRLCQLARVSVTISTSAFLWYRYQSCMRKLEGNIFLSGSLFGTGDLFLMYLLNKRIRPIDYTLPKD